MRNRIIAVAIIRNEENKILVCRMANSHGVFPGKWGVVGGGMEPDETIEQTLIREVKEETNTDVVSVKPLFFDDAHKTKTYKDGKTEELYMIFLLFEVKVSGEVSLNDEWSEYKWIDLPDVFDLDLNEVSRKNFKHYQTYFYE